MADGFLVSSAGMAEDDKYKQSSGGLCRLIGRVWKNERLGKGLCGPSMKVWYTEAAVGLWGNENGQRGSARGRVGFLHQHLREVQDGEGKEKA